MLGFTHTPWVFLLLANLLMLFVGCFLEPTAAILILVPVLMPVVLQLGIDPVHFGLVMVLNLMIGLLHPPMGMVLFVLARVAGLSVEKTTMAILPWLVPLLLSPRPDHLRAADLAVAAARLLQVRPPAAMTAIRAVEILQVDLAPKVVRTDAIQAFVTQETPIVRIRCDDGAEGTGYTLHDRHRRLVGRRAAARSSGAAADRPRSGADRGDLEGPLLRDARHRRRRDHEPRAGRDRHRAVGHPGASAPGCRCGKPPAARSAGCRVYTTEGGWLQLPVATLVEQTLAAKAAGFRGAKIKVGKPHVAEDVARLAAVREAVGDGFELMVDANQCFNVSEAIRRARAFEPFGLAWLEEPLPAEDLAGHVELAAHTAIPIAVGESLYHPAHFREYLERDACSIVQVDCARIGGITPWLKVAHLAETFNVAGLPALPDGAPRVADRGRAERGVGRVHPPARRHHHVAAGDRRTATPSRPTRRASASTGISTRSPRAPSHALRAIPTLTIEGGPMLTRASLTIRLHPNDDVVIARAQLVGGTTLIDEKVTVSGLVPPGHKVAVRAIAAGEPVKRYNQVIGFASRDIAPGEHVHLHNLQMRTFDRDYAFGADVKPTQFVASPATFQGIVRADGRVATRNYLGILSTVNCSATVARGIADAFSHGALAEFPNVDGVVALTHGSGCGMDSNGESMQRAAAHARRLRAAPNFAGVLVVGLGCESNQISALLGAEDLQRGPAAAHVQHPGYRRHDQDDRQRHGDDPRNAAARERGHAAAGAGVAHRGRTAMRRLRRLFGHHRQSGAGRRGRHAGAPRRHRHPVGNARGLRRRAPADAPRGVARGRRKAGRAHQVVGGLHGAQQGRDEQQPVAGQQGGRAHHDPREIAGRGGQGRHDQPRRRVRIRGAGRPRRASCSWTRRATTRCPRPARSPAAPT